MHEFEVTLYGIKAKRFPVLATGTFRREYVDDLPVLLKWRGRYFLRTNSITREYYQIDEPVTFLDNDLTIRVDPDK